MLCRLFATSANVLQPVSSVRKFIVFEQKKEKEKQNALNSLYTSPLPAFSPLVFYIFYTSCIYLSATRMHVDIETIVRNDSPEHERVERVCVDKRILKVRNNLCTLQHATRKNVGMLFSATSSFVDRPSFDLALAGKQKDIARRKSVVSTFAFDERGATKLPCSCIESLSFPFSPFAFSPARSSFLLPFSRERDHTAIQLKTTVGRTLTKNVLDFADNEVTR